MKGRWRGPMIMSIISMLSLHVQLISQLSLGTPFGDHMVIQRERENPFWGWCAPGARVTVTIDGRTVEGSADANGRWSVMLPAHPAGGPVDIALRSEGEEQTLKDVLIGEVWLCSGQSNMSFRLDQTDDAVTDIARASVPLLRLCTVPRMLSETPLARGTASWQPCTPEAAAKFSAVAYFFGDSLVRTLGVPVGLIHASWGGTAAESWVPRSVLASDTMLSPILDRWNKSVREYPEAFAAYQRTAKWRADSADAVNSGMAPPARPQAPKGPGNRDTPSGQWNAMINPLVPFGMKGVIWYQGEGNASRAYQYRTLFPSLIRHWRNAWGYEFPFYYVQLPNLKRKPGSGWPELREAQLMTLSVPLTGMAVTIDVGDSLDLHPRNKRPVGARLASLALHQTYGIREVPGGEIRVAGTEVEGNTMRIRFTPVSGAIRLTGGEIRGFTISGDDRVFRPAQGRIEGTDLILWNRTIIRPVAVRYAWGENPPWSVTDATGIPASPFRTDDWPEATMRRR